MLNRRRFLKSIAAAAATPGIALAESQGDGEQQAPQEGYRLTQHILAYYKSAAS